jgi:hypothetical protein
MSEELHKLGFKYKFIYSMTGLFLGLACIVAGVVLGLSGVAGHTAWTASALGLETTMTDATPGVIVFVVGIFLVWMTRFSVKATYQPTQPQPVPQQQAAVTTQPGKANPPPPERKMQTMMEQAELLQDEPYSQPLKGGADEVDVGKIVKSSGGGLLDIRYTTDPKL